MIINAGNDFDSMVKNGTSLVEVGASWCGPCKQMSRVLDELDKEITTKIIKVDAEQAPEKVSELGVYNIPAFFIYKDGVLQHSFVGAKTKQELKFLLERYG